MKNFYLFSASLLLLLGCKNSGDNVSVPLEEMSDVVSEFEHYCVEYDEEAKLESSDHRLTVYAVSDLNDDYDSNCLVLYYVDGAAKVVSEQLWRKKYGLRDDDPCPLFSNGHKLLYTVESDLNPDSPTYVIVTVERLEDAYISTGGEVADGMCLYAHAYRIKDGQLQPENTFTRDGEKDYLTERDTTEWVEWVQELKSVWPAHFDKKAKRLEIADLSEEGAGIIFGKDVWNYDDKIGFVYGHWEPVTEDTYYEYPYTLTMSEQFPKHKVQISTDGDGNYQYAAWDAKKSWASKPSVIVCCGVDDIENDCYRFQTDDGYEYIVHKNPYSDDVYSYIEELEVRKNGTVIYRETIEY